MYPKLHIYLRQLEENAKKVVDLCTKASVQPTAVVKVTDGNLPIAQTLIQGGFQSIGDSRINNLKSYTSLPVDKFIIRSSMPSSLDKTVAYSTHSIESHLSVLKGLSEEALKQDKIHKVLLGVELGDLREGIYGEENLLQIAKKGKEFKGIKIVGVSGNFNDLCGIAPSKENLEELLRLGHLVANECAIDQPIFSGGNSSSLELILNKTLPKGINHIRTGVGWIEGRIDNVLPLMEDYNHHPFVLEAEIIELFEKPTKPWGQYGANLDFQVPEFEDRGHRLRAILALGRADVQPGSYTPVDQGVEILGSCSDHTVLDVEDCPRNLKPGDTMLFHLEYLGLLRSLSSKHVTYKYHP
ncbi:MAG: alanine racemase [Tissierellia bacterium]|nr:alanine racemase [Tissierellia bacterium]